MEVHVGPDARQCLAIAWLAAACSIYDASLADSGVSTDVGSGGSTGWVSTSVTGNSASGGRGGGATAAGMGGVGGVGGSPEAGSSTGAGGDLGFDGGFDASSGEANSTDSAPEANGHGDAEAGLGPDSADAGRGPPTTFQDLCRFTRAVVVDNNTASDTAGSQQLLAELQAACGTSLTIRVAAQTTAGLLATDGRPLWNETELGTLSGGPAVQTAVAYFNRSLSPVYVQTSGNNFTWIDRASSSVVASIARPVITMSHDVAVIQVVAEPMGNTFPFNVYAQQANGTVAAAFYFRAAIAPNLKIDTKRYYVVEWMDQDGDLVPTAGDLYQLRASR